METIESSRKDDDLLWKGIIERFFYEMLQRAVPELYRLADTTQEVRFLDKELRRSSLFQKSDKNFVDLLAEVPLKNGDNKWLLLHCEVQSKGGDPLPLRMLLYMCMIRSLYKDKDIVALAILTDKRPESEGAYYHHSLCGTEITYRYNTLNIPALNEHELLCSDNPFDLALCAGLRAFKGGNDQQQKYTYARELLGLLGERGWNKEAKKDLWLFISAIVNLTEDRWIQKIKEYLEELQEEGKLMGVSAVEEYGRRQGIEQGILQGIQQGASQALRQTALGMKQEGLPLELIAKITKLPLEEIQALKNA